MRCSSCLSSGASFACGARPAARGRGVAGSGRGSRRRCRRGGRSGIGHGTALPVSQAGRSPPGQRPRNSMPRPPSQKICTIGSGNSDQHRAGDDPDVAEQRVEQAGAHRVQRDEQQADGEHERAERQQHAARTGSAPLARASRLSTVRGPSRKSLTTCRLPICESSDADAEHDAADDRQVDDEAPERAAARARVATPRKPTAQPSPTNPKKPADRAISSTSGVLSWRYSKYGDPQRRQVADGAGLRRAHAASRARWRPASRAAAICSSRSRRGAARRRATSAAIAARGAVAPLPRRVASRGRRSARPRPRTL